MNANTVYSKTIFDLPDICIMNICQLLITSSEGGLQNVISFRATNRYFYDTINRQILKIPLEIRLHERLLIKTFKFIF